MPKHNSKVLEKAKAPSKPKAMRPKNQGQYIFELLESLCYHCDSNEIVVMLRYDTKKRTATLMAASPDLNTEPDDDTPTKVNWRKAERPVYIG